jgi:hypothetical protein
VPREGPFERLLRQRPDRDPAPLIIGGTIAFLALVIVLVFVFSSVLGGGGDDGGSDGETVEVAPGVTGTLTSPPPLPPGLDDQSQYIEFETEKDVQAIIGLPLTEPATDEAGLGFYSFMDNRWQRQADVTLVQEGKVAQGEFEIVPANLAVLKVIAGTYQVISSLPHDSTLHGDSEAVQVVSTRDYVPASDATVQGTATDFVAAEGTLRLPTIVGSGEDTAAVVDDLISDEAKRAEHVQNIVTLVTDSDVDGIDLEYSAVDPDLSSEFTAFVTALAGSLHSDEKRLSLTLPPPGEQKQPYEWDKLGAQADFLRVLPVADPTSYWDAMPAALSEIAEKTDTRKVFLVASPFSIEGQGDSARAIGYLNAMVMASQAAVREPKNPDDIKPGAEVTLVAKNLDEKEGASPMEWNDDALAVSFAVGGNERTRIFIENSYSVNFKLELVQSYALGGVAIADGSAQSDVANLWPAINYFVTTNTTDLFRPNESMLTPGWDIPDGGEIEGSGTTAKWTPTDPGEVTIILTVSDGERRFGQKLVVAVRGEKPSSTPTPRPTFAPETGSATPTPAQSTASPTPTKAAGLAVEVGKVADGTDADSIFSNNEITAAGEDVTYLITFDNDSSIPVSILSIVDNLFPNAATDCKGPGNAAIIGTVLAPDDGDGPGVINGGADQVQCTFKVTAPDEAGEVVINTVEGTVKDEEGNTASDSDDTRVTTE